MNPSLCLCKPSYSSKQSSIEAVLLNLQPDGSSTPRQSGELQFVLKVWAQLWPPPSELASLMMVAVEVVVGDKLFPRSIMKKEMSV